LYFLILKFAKATTYKIIYFLELCQKCLSQNGRKFFLFHLFPQLITMNNKRLTIWKCHRWPYWSTL